MDDPTFDSAPFFDSGGHTLPLPVCANGIYRIDVRDVGGSHPFAVVECATAPTVIDPPSSGPTEGN